MSIGSLAAVGTGFPMILASIQVASLSLADARRRIHAQDRSIAGFRRYLWVILRSVIPAMPGKSRDPALEGANA
jgi:hypothetical protein